MFEELLVSGDDNIGIGELTINPTCCMEFYEANNKMGELSWEKGIFKFEGNMEESARIFFENFLKPRMEGELL